MSHWKRKKVSKIRGLRSLYILIALTCVSLDGLPYLFNSKRMLKLFSLNLFTHISNFLVLRNCASGLIAVYYLADENEPMKLTTIS